MTRVFDVQELDRVEFLTMFCSNSKGALLQFRATIRDGRDILSIHIDKAEGVELGTVSSEFRQFIHYLCAFVYSGSYSVDDLNNTASDTIF